MRRFTEKSLVDVVKVIRHLDPDAEDAALIEAFVGLLGFTMKQEAQSPPPPPPPPPPEKKNSKNQSESSSQKDSESPLPEKRRSSNELQLRVLNEPYGNSMPAAIRDAAALWDDEPEMPTVSLTSYAPSIPLLPMNRARSYIYDVFSEEVFLGEIDVDSIIEQLAKGAVPTITYLRKKVLQGPVHVMIDKNRSMEPFEHDADELYRYITNLFGKEACEGYWCFDTPDDELVRISNYKRFERYPEKPLPKTLLVLVSDLGAARPFGWLPVPRYRWIAALQRLAPLFSRIVVVSPYPKKRLPDIRTRNIEMVPWGKARYASCPGDEESVMNELATLIAPAAYLNRDIVRSVRATFYPVCYPGLEADLIYSWMMAVSNPLVLTFRPETQRELREQLILDEPLRKKAYDFIREYRKHCRQFTFPKWIEIEEDLMRHALNREPEAVNSTLRQLIRSLIEFEEHPRLARWALSIAKALPEEQAFVEERQQLQIAAALRLGLVPKEFEESGYDSSWLLPKATTIGIRQEEGQIRFVDNPAFDDMRLSVPGTVPRFLKIEGADGSSQSLRLWKGHNDVMVSEQLLPMTISTLSGARYRFGELVTNIRTVRILIVSPSDVAVEREIAVAVINEWNIRNKDIHKLELEAVLWEFHSAPESGDRVQGILNKQIVDKCDFAIAIFWKWIGPYTGVAPGGAVEEVQRLMQAGKQVMFYFSNASYRTKDVDLEQVAAIEQFKKSLQKNALVLDYYERHEFKDKLFHQLDLNLKRWYKLSAETGAIERFENQRLLQRYQETLKKHLSEVNLLGSRVIDSFSVQLADTFFSLRLSDTWRSDRRFETGFANDGMDGARTRNPEEVMSLVFKHHQLLLVIGDSGSGKTTLLKYYALSCMDDGQYRAFGFSEPVSVFYLPLRELKKSNHDHESLPAALASWCVKRYFKDISVESFDAWLERPSILVLLDGLDEISDVQERIAVCLWIDRTVKRFGKARFVVTSRSTGYRKGDGIEIVTSHVRADLMDITPEQQVEFLHKWFKAAYLRELHPDHMSEREWRETQEKRAHEKSIVLADYLNQEQNRSLRMMASQPLLLQIMAILWKERDYLPNSRMKLYDAALDYLLDYRNKQKAIYPLLPAEDARRVLSPVALWMQEKLGTDEADRVAMQKEMQTVLDTLSRSINASVFCRNLVDLTGVLVEYGDNQYVFRLKTFREYLAALQLKKNVYHNSGILDNLVPHFGDDWWSEVFRFFIELLGDEYLFEKFIQKLFESSVTENLTPKQQNLLLTLVREAPMKKYDVMIEKLFDSATTANRKHYLVECLKVIGREDALNAVLRYEKMEGGTVFVNPLELDANYILVRGGTFKYSVTNRTETVPDYWLARYPVTNRLYRRFINYLKTDKYGDRELIPVDRFMMELEGFADMNGLSDHHRLMQSDKGLANEFASSCDLDEHDDPFNRDEHPVVGITWYAAKAYCIWLSLMESRGETIALYRLPTEIEWEYAAAGKEGRAYPWGNSEPSPKLANYGNNERATTPVGTYPDGATPEGLHDMAGNVAEWMENWYDEAKPFRALRGGAWGIDSYALRCSARINFAPADWHNNFGFRVLRSANILES